MLMGLVQFVIRRLPNSLSLMEESMARCGYKRSLLKVMEGKYKGKHGEAQVEARS
jgi:hypothetical protein